MPVPQTGQPVLDYASAVSCGSNPYLRPMRDCRTMCGGCVGGVLLGLLLWSPLAVVAGVVALVPAVFTIYFLGRAAAAEVGAGYAARQVAWAPLLYIIFLLGIWVMPLVVEQDLSKRRAGREG
jgi:hypothetical protein